MATIKSFTDIPQSKKLVKILPLESADMRIGNYVGESGKVDGTNVHYYPKGESFGAPEIIDAWSLAALLGVLPYPFLSELSNGIWKCGCYPSGICNYVTADSPIDACYEMIIKLNELNLI